MKSGSYASFVSAAAPEARPGGERDDPEPLVQWQPMNTRALELLGQIVNLALPRDIAGHPAVIEARELVGCGQAMGVRKEPETLDEAIDALGPLLAPLPANAASDGEPRVTELPARGPLYETQAEADARYSAPEPTLTREKTGRFEAALREAAALDFAAPEMMTPREAVCDVCGCPGDLSRAEAPGAGETWACEPCQDGSVRK